MNTSLGEDPIHTYIIKEPSLELKKYLLDIYKRTWGIGIVPNR